MAPVPQDVLPHVTRGVPVPCVLVGGEEGGEEEGGGAAPMSIMEALIMPAADMVGARMHPSTCVHGRVETKQSARGCGVLQPWVFHGHVSDPAVAWNEDSIRVDSRLPVRPACLSQHSTHACMQQERPSNAAAARCLCCG